MDSSRRQLIIGGSAILTSSLAFPLSSLAQEKNQTKAQPKKEEGEEEVSTNEDLMREHGVLNRVLLIYEEAERRIAAKQQFDLAVIGNAAGLIKSFIEDYHEKLEENHLFPRFEQAGKLVELTVVLRAQHAMGRRVTERLLASAKSKDLKTMSESLHQFVRMYRPHEAREDTVLFPALHQIVTPHEYDAMGEQFEKIERQTFGGDGFDMAVDKVTGLEKQLGIYDLSQFTPNVPRKS
ncbi:MAG TPA: hemerythrin domain-containing protein [Terriglobales bacterium]|nr:hemerythrin domain-containing protein [Terriglobales bacterium]